MVYHGSLKGVGNSHSAFVTDVRGFGHPCSDKALWIPAFGATRESIGLHMTADG